MVRTSTSCSMPQVFSSAMNSSIGCVECPTVKIVNGVLIELSIAGDSSPTPLLVGTEPTSGMASRSDGVRECRFDLLAFLRSRLGGVANEFCALALTLRAVAHKINRLHRAGVAHW